MRMASTLFRKAGYSLTIAAAMVFSSTTPAGTLGLPDAPLFLAAGAQPNLIMAIDDSGSMDFEVLFPSNDGAAWWRLTQWGSCTAATANSFYGCRNNATGTDDIPAPGELNFNNSGESSFNIPQDNRSSNDLQVWRKFIYLFPNGADPDDDRDPLDDEAARTTALRRLSDNGGHYAIPPIPAYAWARSPDINAAYFDPSEKYDPWVSNDDFTFNNSDPEAARFDPVFQTNLTINLKQDRAGTGSVASTADCSSTNTGVAPDHYFQVYRGMTLPSGTCIRREGTNSWTSLTSDCRVGNTGCSVGDDTAVAIRYFPATFYLKSTTTLPASFGYTAAATTTGKAPDGSNLNGYEIKRANFRDDTSYNAAIQNFANWFTYYRKRHQALRAGLGEAFSDITGIRVDGYTINNRQGVTMGSIDASATKLALYDKFYTKWVRSGGTPNRSAVARMISEFQRTDDDAPVTAACQKNFGMLFTDGFSNSPAPGDGITGVYDNVDQNSGNPYSDGYAGSLADAVMSAYTTPLRSDTNFPRGKVSVSNNCPAAGTDYSGPLDCNRDLHMNFYAVTLNTRGLQFNVAGVEQDPYKTKPTWPTNFPPRHPSAVDDLWHATVNGRGKLLNATSPKDISTQLRSVLSSVVEKTSSAAAAAVNGGTITTNSIVYQARFDSSDWSGQLLSYSINPQTGDTIPSTVRDAASNIPAASARNIFTRNSAGQAVEFKWDNLQADTTRVAQLDPDSNAVAAQNMLNYLRGDDTNEGLEPTKYRQRTTLLGDIVNSGPLYVGAPPFRYRDSLESAPYSTFASSKSDRQPMIYVGANDGMLHAFYADGSNRGTEAFAYIPTSVFPNLRNLASQTYGHRFYVDGSPSMGDAFFSGSWHTVLVGGLNKGGQGMYALDITNPTSFDKSKVLWEFTDADDPDLGFTYSQATIAKLRDGKWYAVFGNGYNSRLADGNASTTGSAVLFIVDLDTGRGRKIDTGEGFNERGETGNALDQAITYDNGLATPSLVDTNGDRVVEYAYAGDLYGNLWKFDLSSTNPNNWKVAFDGVPLFKARNDAGKLQPITARPEVTRGPNGNGYMVLFGTGKYLEADDKLLTPQLVNSFYGIVDRGSPVTYTTDRASVLTKQSILVEVPAPRTAANGDAVDNEIRITTDNMLGANQGWYMDLLSPGGYENEKQVTDAVVRDQRVIFTTLTPDTDPCGFGGTSWLMELDLRDGSRLEISPFDLNIDGTFDDTDMVMVDLGDGNGPRLIPPGGIRKKRIGGILPRPTIATGEFGTEGKPVQYKYLPSSSGGILVIIENPGADNTGRQSWRQIR